MTPTSEIREAFLQAFSSISSATQTGLHCWTEIEKAYQDAGRFYHNLQHLNFLLVQLAPLRSSILDWNAVVFAIAYHDIVYSVTKGDNEEKSAARAVQDLSPFAGSEMLKHCEALILATKNHNQTGDSDLNYFTDADLCILGAAAGEYRQYAQAIRMEYKIFPDEMYVPGRKKVLLHFFEKQRIFKTNWFYNRYEQTARENLAYELSRLSG